MYLWEIHVFDRLPQQNYGSRCRIFPEGDRGLFFLAEDVVHIGAVAMQQFCKSGDAYILLIEYFFDSFSDVNFFCFFYKKIIVGLIVVEIRRPGLPVGLRFETGMIYEVGKMTRGKIQNKVPHPYNTIPSFITFR